MGLNRFLATSALAERVCVKLVSGELVVATDSTAPIIGITQQATAAGDIVPLWRKGDIVRMTADASIAPGTPVTATTAGAVASAAALTSSVARYIVGRCVRTISSTACEVEIDPQFTPADA